jgi:hypothetical protein
MNRLRLTIDLAEHQSRRLAEIEEQTGLSKAAIIREALMLYDYAAELAGNAQELCAVDTEDGTRTKLVILSLRKGGGR